VPEKAWKLTDGMIPLAALAAHMEQPQPLAAPAAPATDAGRVPAAPVPSATPAPRAPAAHAPWGPDVWPELVRENVEVWPPHFKERELTEAVRRPIGSPRRIAILSCKDDVGKSSIAQLLRAIYATHRDGGSVVLDANGRSARRPGLVLEPDRPVREGARAHVAETGDVVDGVVERLGDGSATTVTPPAADSGYGELMSLLAEHYEIVLADIGTATSRESLHGVLDNCDQIIVVATPRLDGVYAATACLADIRAAGYDELAANAVVALNRIKPMPFSDLVNIDRHFRRSARTVIRITWDERLAGGQLRSLDELRPSTRTGLYELAAAVAEPVGESEPRERGVTHASVPG
jgi:MinD-like ATPase involved in chromosome partitioning or flagellar assembly